MNYKKLTYNGAEYNNYIYFAFEAELFDTLDVTNKLKLQPTSVRLKKEPVPKSTSWNYEVNANNDLDIAIHLERLIDVFESKIEEINKLKTSLDLKTRLQFVLNIDINPDTSTPYFPLNSRVIAFLAKTGTEVDFDLYKSDTIGLLSKIEED